MRNLVAPRPAATTTAGAQYFRLPIALMFLGALSSFITTAWDSVFEGVVFRVAIVCGLVAFRVLKNPVKAALLILFSLCAFYAAYFVSFVSQLVLSGLGLLSESEEYTMSGGSPSPIALFIGGLVGGFLLVYGVLWLITPGGGRRTRKAVLWSVASGILAVVGWALSPVLGPVLSHVVRILPGEAWLTPQSGIQGGPLGMICSIFFVWQTCMAFAIGLMVQAKNQGSNQEKPQ